MRTTASILCVMSTAFGKVQCACTEANESSSTSTSMTMCCRPSSGSMPKHRWTGLAMRASLFEVDVRLDAVVELVDVDLEAGHEVRADDLVAVHLEVGDVVAADVTAEVAEAGEQLARGLDLLRRRAHAVAPARLAHALT